MITRALDKPQVKFLREAEKKCKRPDCAGACKKGWLEVTKSNKPVVTKLASSGLLVLSKTKAQAHLSRIGRTALACTDAPFSETDFEKGMIVEHRKTRSLYKMLEPFDNGFTAVMLNESAARSNPHFFSWAEACAFKKPDRSRLKKKLAKTNGSVASSGDPMERVMALAASLGRTKRARARGK